MSIGRAEPERDTSAGVVEHLGDVGDLHRCSDVAPEPVVPFANLVLWHSVSAATYSVEHALHCELNRHHNHVEMDEVSEVNCV